MNRRLVLLALALLAPPALAGCGALDPFATAPPTLPPGVTAGSRVAICYNTLSTPLAAVQQEAQQECDATSPQTLAVPAETDWYLQNCPLLLPARATFTCAGRR
jgi:hypothetical protein